MNAIFRMHEGLGDEYLAQMRGYGVQRPPVVGWESTPGGTVAMIFWQLPRDLEEVAGFPLELIAGEVARRVIARLGSGN